MPFGKRKRTSDDSSSHAIKPADEAPTRRATRQAIAENAKQLRSGKVRANATQGLVTLEPSSPPAPKKKKDAPNSKTPEKVLRQSTLPRRPASRVNARAAITPEPEKAPPKPTKQVDNVKDVEKEKENVRPPLQRARETAIPPPKLPPHVTSPTSRSPTSSTVRQQTRILPPPFPQPTRIPAQAPASTLSNPAAASAVTPARRASIANNKKPPPTPGNDRNIDQVVLGDISFRAWYPSYYTKEVLADVSSNAGYAKIGGGKKDKESMIDLLYVCPCCFKYSNQLVPFRQHVKLCERTWQVPGTKIYTHPRAKPGIKSPLAGPRLDAGKKKASAHAAPAASPSQLTAVGEWSVWELDGENDGVSQALNNYDVAMC
jgi:hypothetical protein